MKVSRACRIFLAGLILFLCFAAVPGRTAAEPTAPVGMIKDGVWHLDPANYTYRALQNIKELNLSGKGIRSVEGIEHLGGLVSLDLSYNELEELDLSTCRKLSELNCSHNRLNSLDLSHCSRLKVLDCSDNPLGELNVSVTKNLQTLDCRNCELKTLDTGANRTLTELYCSGNELRDIYTGNLKRLKTLDVADTGVSALDVSSNDALTALDCSGNPELRELNLKTNRRLRELHTDGTAIDSLDLSAQRGLAEAFCSRNGYRYELTDEGQKWILDNGLLTTVPEATVKVGTEIMLTPAEDDLRNRIALPGYLAYKPGEFTQHLLSSTYGEMCQYFAEQTGGVFRKASEEWYYENAHTVVEKAGIAVQAWREENDKVKEAARAFTVFDENGNFKYRCTVVYMDTEQAEEFAKRLNGDHGDGGKSETEDLWGYTGQVQYYACGNALVTMEGIPSLACEQTPTLESYIMRGPATQLYLLAGDQ